MKMAMNGPRRMRTAVLAVLVALVGAVLGLAGAPSAASAAVTNYQIVDTPSAQGGSTDVKTAFAACPSGTQALGGAFRILGGDGNVLLTEMTPSAGGVTVRASEDQDGTTDSWFLHAVAICATLPTGSVRYLPSNATIGTGVSHTATVGCGVDERSVGFGVKESGADGQVSIVGALLADGTGGGSFVNAHVDQDGFTGSWSLSTVAVCLRMQAVQNLTFAVTSNGSPGAQEVDQQCPSGTVLTGVGWSLSGGTGEMMNDLITNTTFVRARATEDDDGDTANWTLLTSVRCTNL